MDDLKQYFSEKCALIEKHLEHLVPEQPVPFNQLYKAARYSLIGGGKRLRPILALATTEVLGGNPLQALSPACALEMIHTYSLIHDDLPCMDNDDFRRGKPSLHKAFPEGHAVLTGDFLLTYAFEILADDPHLTPHQKTQLIRCLAKSSGAHGMIGGQIMDIDAEGKSIDLHTLQAIHENKTGALITASIQFGAIIANASNQHQLLLTEFGKKIGLAFQIVDDILDITSNRASDAANHKSTYATLLGLEQAQNLASSTVASALQTLEELPFNTSLLRHLAEYTVNRKA